MLFLHPSYKHFRRCVVPCYVAFPRRTPAEQYKQMASTSTAFFWWVSVQLHPFSLVGRSETFTRVHMPGCRCNQREYPVEPCIWIFFCTTAESGQEKCARRLQPGLPRLHGCGGLVHLCDVTLAQRQDW